jgi:triacylglycerol lipase
VTHYRWVHNNDVVTRVPPAWMGYRHCGNELYLDRFGRIRRLSGILRSRDRWRGILGGLLQWRLDLLTDHSISQYAGHIATAVKEEIAGQANQRRTKTADDLVIRIDSEESPCRESALPIHRIKSGKSKGVGTGR